MGLRAFLASPSSRPAFSAYLGQITYIPATFPRQKTSHGDMLSVRAASSLLASTSGSVVPDFAKLATVVASRAYHKNVSSRFLLAGSAATGGASGAAQRRFWVGTGVGRQAAARDRLGQPGLQQGGGSGDGTPALETAQRHSPAPLACPSPCRWWTTTRSRATWAALTRPIPTWARGWWARPRAAT